MDQRVDVLFQSKCGLRPRGPMFQYVIGLRSAHPSTGILLEDTFDSNFINKKHFLVNIVIL